MNYPLILLIALFSLTSCKENTSENQLGKDKVITTFYLIRHAEKATGNDPLLTDEGIAHANFWAEYLSDKNIDLVYSTDTRRTRATAQPAAEMFDTTIAAYSPQEGFSQRLKEETARKNVLIVGHSNTVPFLANAILGKEKFKEIDEKNFDNIYVVTLNGEKVTARKIKLSNWDKE
ncbi:MAG: phosphoglycerate mutase family protein [Leeuwenhoekiella sp.]